MTQLISYKKNLFSSCDKAIVIIDRMRLKSARENNKWPFFCQAAATFDKYPDTKNLSSEGHPLSQTGAEPSLKGLVSDILK